MNIQKAKLPTSSSVAKLAGVSQSAVSDALQKEQAFLIEQN